MGAAWVPRLIALLGLLALIHSLTRPWALVRVIALRLDYKPWELLEQMARGKWDLVNELLRLAEEIPEGARFVSLFTLHIAFLVIALLLGFLSIIGNSAGGYASTAVFSTLSVAVLLYTLEQAQLLSFSIGSGALLSIGAAFVYVLSALTARSFK
ncbi:MAG: hypothetical protein QXF87_09500 [Thermofilaceae archaeon]